MEIELPNYIPQIPVLEGVKQEAPATFQGNPLIMIIDVDSTCYNDDAQLFVFIKESLECDEYLWRGSQELGIEKKDDKVIINVPNTVSRNLPSGLYYVTLIAMNAKEMNVLCNSPIQITPSAASPLPISVALEENCTLPSVPMNWFYQGSIYGVNAG